MSRAWLLALALAGSITGEATATAQPMASVASALVQDEERSQDGDDQDQEGAGGDEVVAPPETTPPPEGERDQGSEVVEAEAPAEPATDPEAQPVGRPPFADPSPLESTDPVVSVVGTGAPEVLVWFEGDRPGLEELSWRLGVAAALGEQLDPGKGTVHVLVDTGQLPEGVGVQGYVFEYLVQQPRVVTLGKLIHGPPPALRRRPVEQTRRNQRLQQSRSHGMLSSMDPSGARLLMDQGIEEWLHVGLGLEVASLWTAEQRDLGQWLRHPNSGPWKWAAYRSGTREDQRQTWLAGEPVEQPGLQDMEELVPGFDTDEVWPEAVVLTEDGIATALSGRSVMSAATVAELLLERLVSPARVTTTLVGPPEHLGGDLWQVDLDVGAPALQPQAVDPNRTYPKARFSVPLSWSGTVEGAAFPSLARLAWRTEGAEHFELLPERGIGSGRYGFPADDLPAGVTLRLVISAPGALDGGRALNIGLDAGRSGRADLDVRLGASPAAE